MLDHSTFTGNQATASLGAGPVLIHGNAVGGAVKITGGSQATVSHTTFAGNLRAGATGPTAGPARRAVTPALAWPAPSRMRTTA